MFKIYKLMGDVEKASECIVAASKAREAFYIHYKQRYPNDGYLIKRFAEEYYLSCAERMKYIQDPIEKKITENTIRSFLSRLESGNDRQHVVLKQLRSVFEGGN